MVGRVLLPGHLALVGAPHLAKIEAQIAFIIGVCKPCELEDVQVAQQIAQVLRFRYLGYCHFRSL